MQEAPTQQPWQLEASHTPPTQMPCTQVAPLTQEKQAPPDPPHSLSFWPPKSMHEEPLQQPRGQSALSQPPSPTHEPFWHAPPGHDTQSTPPVPQFSGS
jgi:hypothetical protein